MLENSKRGERKAEGGAEGESKPFTSGKLAAESVTDEVQAAPYEPVFTSFSGQLDRILSSVSKGSRAVSEFVLEDAEAGKEHTSKGERYVARPSFMQGLKKVFDSDASAEEVERLQGAFSIDYILNKARQWAAGALNKLGGDSGIGGGPGGGPTNEKSPAGQPISEAESLPHPAANRYTSNIEEDALRRHHLSPEARLIAFGTGDGTLSDAGYTPEARVQEQVAPAAKICDADSVIADAGKDSRSNATQSPGGRNWTKAENPPVAPLIKYRAYVEGDGKGSDLRRSK